MRESSAALIRVPRIPIPTKARLARLGLGVALSEAARLAGMPLQRASVIERNPELARPGELERLAAGVQRAAQAAGRP